MRCIRLYSNHTYELCNLLNQFFGRWFRAKKMRSNSTIKRFKARLVVRGFTQKKEVNFFNTYSLVSLRYVPLELA